MVAHVPQLFLFVYFLSTVRAPSQPALDYKPQILGPTFLVYVLKQSVILTSLEFENGVKNIQTAGYNGARMVLRSSMFQKNICWEFTIFMVIGDHCVPSLLWTLYVYCLYAPVNQCRKFSECDFLMICCGVFSRNMKNVYDFKKI